MRADRVIQPGVRRAENAAETDLPSTYRSALEERVREIQMSLAEKRLELSELENRLPMDAQAAELTKVHTAFVALELVKRAGAQRRHTKHLRSGNTPENFKELSSSIQYALGTESKLGWNEKEKIFLIQQKTFGGRVLLTAPFLTPYLARALYTVTDGAQGSERLFLGIFIGGGIGLVASAMVAGISTAISDRFNKRRHEAAVFAAPLEDYIAKKQGWSQASEFESKVLRAALKGVPKKERVVVLRSLLQELCSQVKSTTWSDEQVVEHKETIKELRKTAGSYQARAMELLKLTDPNLSDRQFGEPLRGSLGTIVESLNRELRAKRTGAMLKQYQQAQFGISNEEGITEPDDTTFQGAITRYNQGQAIRFLLDNDPSLDKEQLTQRILSTAGSEYEPKLFQSYVEAMIDGESLVRDELYYGIAPPKRSPLEPENNVDLKS